MDKERRTEGSSWPGRLGCGGACLEKEHGRWLRSVSTVLMIDQSLVPGLLIALSYFIHFLHLAISGGSHMPRPHLAIFLFFFSH